MPRPLGGRLGPLPPGWGQRAPEYLRPCGTEAAYRRHLRRGEPVDNLCRQAALATWRRRNGYPKGTRTRLGWAR